VKGFFDPKRLFDVVLAAILLIVLAPVQAAVAVAIRRDSPGPIFYRATRVGMGEQAFTMLKFRTMVAGAPQSGPRITGRNDARITRLGRFLRDSRLDELPQLWNVLNGSMSFVGPRPEDPRFVELYDPLQRTVLTVRPGITGRAQLVFRDESRLMGEDDPESDYVERVLPQKLAIDVGYVQQHSFCGDISILVRTIVAPFH